MTSLVAGDLAGRGMCPLLDEGRGNAPQLLQNLVRVIIGNIIMFQIHTDLWPGITGWNPACASASLRCTLWGGMYHCTSFYYTPGQPFFGGFIMIENPRGRSILTDWNGGFGAYMMQESTMRPLSWSLAPGEALTREEPIFVGPTPPGLRPPPPPGERGQSGR
jgi:hypothetical protein